MDNEMITFLVILAIGALIYALKWWDDKKLEEEKERKRGAQDYFIKTDNIVITKEIVFEGAIRVIRFIVDDVNKQVVIFLNELPTYIPFSEIIGCEIIIDNEIAGGVGRAIVGGLLAGGAGAIVGAQTAKKHVMSYDLTIYRKNIQNPSLNIALIRGPRKLPDTLYFQANQFASEVNASIKAIMAQYGNE